MSINQCKTIREEIDHASAGDPVGATVAAHLKTCDQCQAFHVEQSSLRELMANLGTIAAPPDFDFKLKARLAREKSAAVNHGVFAGLLRTFGGAPRAIAVAAFILVGVTGAVLIKNWLSVSAPPQHTAVEQKGSNSANNPEVKTLNPTVGPDKATGNPENRVIARNSNNEGPPAKATSGNRDRNSYSAVVSRKHPAVATRDIALGSAPILESQQSQAGGVIVRIPLDDEALQISIDDGQGRPRMVSLPIVSFGSQRLTSSNSFVPVSTQKGVW
jgi:hypothetical protein